MSSNNTPDLASVLKTLAGLAPQNQQQGYVTHQIHQQAPLIAWPQSTQANHNPTPVSGAKVIDPATILDWSSGLRCVMKTVAKHDSILHEIRRMIKIQHEHEEQWWKGREALKQTQEARKEGQKKLDDVLKLIGGTVSAGSSNTTPEETAKELAAFDMKVHRAQVQMVTEMTARFRNLGIPFFGTKSELVRLKAKSPERVEGGASQILKEGNRMIDEIELVELQRKMLVLLEDLCGE
ncbi:hypothetical protein OIDMADRAFT_18778 [Oidiodendron maius Zn]|uniref:Uncharacterized protein n=1 Tax=Oidiodendron maius (strain Zn) TaxID=913774 RepID=A0A0C3CSL6_OIDMZ|nr:hypothetical protein OIDMADRAFT_18778 [Oidiodendron maius Zn]